MERGNKVYFSPLSNLVLLLMEAERQGRFRERLALLKNLSLPVVDEIGYLPIPDSGTNLFFQVVNAHYEKGSMILTSNKSFKEWGGIFGDPVAASAMRDWLLKNSILFKIMAKKNRNRKKPNIY